MKGMKGTEEVVRPARRPGMLRRLVARRSPREVKVSTALRFYHEVVGLDHLHYGFWNGEPLTLEGLKIAQDRFTRNLLEWIPEGVDAVLDVGCGIGSTALTLKEQGYDVEGLSPDPYHETAFARRVGAPFHLRRFQEFEPHRAYDLVLMSESAQYVWLDSLFPAVARATPGGHLLVADYFIANGARGVLAKSGHPLHEFLERAEAAGFHLERRQDITDQVTPTLDLARSWLERYIDPCLEIISDHAQRKRPWLTRPIRWLLRRQIEKAAEMRTLVDSEAFKHHKHYLILRFKVPG
jgi:MPBQ/MSBQ methyltransferase